MVYTLSGLGPCNGIFWRSGSGRKIQANRMKCSFCIYVHFEDDSRRVSNLETDNAIVFSNSENILRAILLNKSSKGGNTYCENTEKLEIIYFEKCCFCNPRAFCFCLLFI